MKNKVSIGLLLLCVLMLFAPVAQAAMAYETGQIDTSVDEEKSFSNITLYEKSITLTVRELYYIGLKSSKPKGANETQMIFESSNAEVVAIEKENIIRAIAPGRATVTVKAKNGKAKAALQVKVEGFNEKLRFYDAEQDALKTSHKAPVTEDKRIYPRILGALAEQSIVDKYGKYAAEGALPKMTMEIADGELYYAAIYAMLHENENSQMRGQGYYVMPERFPGCSETAMAEIRTWLRESFDGMIIGMAEDYHYDGTAPFLDTDLYEWGGTFLHIDNALQVNKTCFLVDVSMQFGEKGAISDRILLERTENGWRWDETVMLSVS